MRVHLTCFHCMQENKPIKTKVLGLNESGIYEFRCTEGHDVVTRLHGHKFEVLADIGVQAIMDGYYREAVLSFTGALERFYEYYFNIIGIHLNRKEEFSKIWGHVRRQSERQIGVFLGLYLTQNEKAPELLNENTYVKFRNEVVHQGALPTREKALEYGQAIINLIQPIYWDMHTRYKGAQETYSVDQLDRLIAAFPSLKMQGLQAVQMILLQGEKQPDARVPTIEESVKTKQLMAKWHSQSNPA